MNPLDKLKMNKFIKELEYLESEEEYHSQLFVEINSLFMSEVQEKMIVVDNEVEEKYGTARAWPGYDDEPTDFGSGRTSSTSLPGS